MPTIRQNPIHAPDLPKVQMPKATSFEGTLPKPVKPMQGPKMGGFSKPPQFEGGR